MSKQLCFATRTDIGHLRKNNEDAVVDPESTPTEEKALLLHGWLFIVADGMGGAQAGEVASSLATETIHRLFYQAPTRMPRRESLDRAVRSANQAVQEKSEQDPALSGMGTTVTAAAIQDRHTTIAQVGDSRCYLCREGHLQQITRDHSYVQEMLDGGFLTPEEARDHPYRNRVTRVLGTSSTVEPDLFDLLLHPGDMLLLCSDGLTGELLDEEIEAILVNAANPVEAADRLLEAALLKDGRDNISVIVIQAEPREAPFLKDKIGSLFRRFSGTLFNCQLSAKTLRVGGWGSLLGRSFAFDLPIQPHPGDDERNSSARSRDSSMVALGTLH